MTLLCIQRVEPKLSRLYSQSVGFRRAGDLLMALRPGDEETLRAASFLSDYTNYRNQLIDLARTVYSTVSSIYGASPSQNDCEELLATAIMGSHLWQYQIAYSKGHVPFALLPAYALSLARYVLAVNWQQVSSVMGS